MGLIEVRSLPEKVQAFVIELVGMSADAVLASRFNEKLYDSLFTYNRYILQILAILSEDDQKAAEMFARYQLNDPLGFSNMEDASGWNPFGNLLTSSVPEKWKYAADAAMRERIVAEEAGTARPRYEWEQAFRCYRSHIMMRFYSQNPWSVDLFASQIEFMLGVESSREHMLVDTYRLLDVLNLLGGEERRGLRHRLARRVVLETIGEFNQFSVYSSETRDAAQAVIAEFGVEDEELRIKLEGLLEAGQERLREQVRDAANHESEVDSVMKKMA